MKLLNTHFYDGKLSVRYQELCDQEWKNNELISLDQSWKEIKILIIQLVENDQKKKIALNILKRLQSNEMSNYDHKNDIHVHELMPIIWSHVRTYDKSAQKVFIEQLIDMQRGICAQGRVTRLIQLV